MKRKQKTQYSLLEVLQTGTAVTYPEVNSSELCKAEEHFEFLNKLTINSVSLLIFTQKLPDLYRIQVDILGTNVNNQFMQVCLLDLECVSQHAYSWHECIEYAL